MLIFLVGFMGCGKTSAGKLLARSLKLPFLDTDSLIEGKHGASVASIFATKGEKWFREEEALLAHSLKPPAVVATGGGFASMPGVMERLNENGVTVYIEVTPAKLTGRLKDEKSARPLIAEIPDEQLTNFISRLLDARAPFYRKAMITVNGESNPEDLVMEILDKLALYQVR